MIGGSSPPLSSRHPHAAKPRAVCTPSTSAAADTPPVAKATAAWAAPNSSCASSPAITEGQVQRPPYRPAGAIARARYPGSASRYSVSSMAAPTTVTPDAPDSQRAGAAGETETTMPATTRALTVAAPETVAGKMPTRRMRLRIRRMSPGARAEASATRPPNWSSATPMLRDSMVRVGWRALPSTANSVGPSRSAALIASAARRRRDLPRADGGRADVTGVGTSGLLWVS